MQADDNATGDGTTGGAFQPPAFLKKVFEDFAAKYQQFKRMRTVNFRPHLGAV
jgi:Cullin family